MKSLIVLIGTSIVLLFSCFASGAEKFSWPLFLPAITGSGPCDQQDLDHCRRDSECIALGGNWYDDKCNSSVTCSDIAGCYSGTLSDNCPGYWAGGQIGLSINSNCSFSSVSQYGVKNSGTITNRQNSVFSGTGQTDANGCGQFAITCTNNGTAISCNYNYANGKKGSISNTYQGICRSPNQFLTETLAGSWTFRFVILSTWTNYYYLNSSDVSEYPIGSNEYSIYGNNQYGNLIVAGYDPTYGEYNLFDGGTIIDALFTFNYTNTNTVAGCYYQYSHSEGSWSTCYPMNGVRTAKTKSLSITKNADTNYAKDQQLTKEIETTELGNSETLEETTIERLNSIRDRLNVK